MILRDYQNRAIADLRAAYAAGRRSPCLVMPTGGGKTPVSAEIIRLTIARGRRVLFAAGRVELLNQAVAKLAAAGVNDVRMIQAQNDIGNPGAPVVVASVPTLVTPRWMSQLPPADLVVLDEVHHLRCESWDRIATHYSAARLLGLTATPARADSAGLGAILDALVIGSTVRELTDLGYLVPCRVYSPSSVLEAKDIAISPADAYLRYAAGERAVVFCTTVEHAREVAEGMRAAGIATEVVHGQMPDRAEVLARFAAGELRAIANVNICVEGWDDPGAAVCILARRMVHAGTYIQAIGRVLRPAPGKTGAIVVDLCGSALLHGTPDTPREYSLDGKGIRRSDRLAIRQCPRCGAVFLAADVCPECATEMPRQKRAAPRAIEVDVGEIEGGKPAQRPWVATLAAKYGGKCSKCRGRIRIGELIVWSKGARPFHESCQSAEVAA